MVKRQSPHMTKTEKTRETLLRSARSVFGTCGYHRASVAQLCEHANVANGTFYRYFANKEEVFTVLIEGLQAGLLECIERAAGQAVSGKEAVLLAYRGVLNQISQDPNLYRVLRGAELMGAGIHQRFRAGMADAFASVLRAGIQAGELRPVDPHTAAYMLLGIIGFAAMRYAVWEPGTLDEGVLQTLDALILSGFDSGKEMPGSQGTRPDARIRETGRVPRPRGREATHRALLRSAEQLFGDLGFHHTSISAIADHAGVAQGTFYLHFSSKTEVFRELVREINRRFRTEEYQSLARLADRREIEREGFRTFFRFIAMYRGDYRILREAELVDPQTGRWFYESIAKGYVQGLRHGMERREIRALALEPLVYALLGIGHSVALWSLSESPGQLVSEGMHARVLDLLERGLAIYRA